MSARQWFRFENAASDPTVAEIHIIDFIGDWLDDFFGFGVTAKSFVDELSKLPDAVKTIKVHINSPGGDVFAALNIANALREQASKGREVETVIDGLAASAASIIAMAGQRVRMADNALLMIHNPWTVGIGNAAEMRKTAETLDTVRDTIIATYRWHATLDEKDIADLMDAETWMEADEAIGWGFATEKVEGLKAAASLRPQAIAKLEIPEKYRARVEALLKPASDPGKAEPSAPQPAAAAEILRLCAEAGASVQFASALIAENLSLDQAQARIATDKAQREAALARANQIRTLCANAKLAELADGYIAGGMSVEAVMAHLTTITARLDKVEIDGGLRPDLGAADVKTSWQRVIARMNKRR